MMQPSYVDFDEKQYHWKSDIDYRKNPHLYKIGRGQQGVLVCEPYKSEIWEVNIGDLKHPMLHKNLLTNYL